MSANAGEDNDSIGPEGAMTILAVPSEIVQQVIDFVESLEQDDDDVSGYMLSRGLTGNISGAMSVTQNQTHTGITTFQTGAEGTDLKWSDTDTVTFPG
jgi:hypothetical protein